MDNIILSRRWVQGTPVTIDNLTGTAFTGEAQAHTFRISGVDAAGADVQITGTVTGAFLAPNNVTIPLEGTLTDGVAEVTLTSQCYELPGRFILSVYAANGDTNLCIYCGVGYVFCTETDQVAYPSAAIPDISQLIQEAQDVIDSIPEDYTALSAHFPATGKFVVGTNTSATEENAVAEGEDTIASGLSSHAEGYASEASGDYSHSEGGSIASGGYSHAEGSASEASGENAHAEGLETTASGDNSHSEGWGTTSSGMNAHAEGVDTVASGNMSHSEGEGTIANHAAQSVSGTYNVADTSQAAVTAKGTYAEIVGNGTADNARSNARTLDWSGNEDLAGDLTINKNGANEMTVGQELSDLKSIVRKSTGNSMITIEETSYLRCANSPVDFTDVGTATDYSHTIINVSAGDKFRITGGSSGAAARLYCFTDNDGVIKENAAANTTVNDKLLVAPEGATKLIINKWKSAVTPVVAYYGDYLINIVDDNFNESIEYTDKITERIITTTNSDLEKGQIDDTDGTTITATNTRIYTKTYYPVKAGDFVVASQPNLAIKVAFYNTNKAYINSMDNFSCPDMSVSRVYSWTVCEHDGYIRLSMLDLNQENPGTHLTDYGNIATIIHRINTNYTRVGYRNFPTRINHKPGFINYPYVYQDGTVINGNLWLFSDGQSASGDISVINAETGALVAMKTHQLGHANSVDYNATNDMLITYGSDGDDQPTIVLYKNPGSADSLLLTDSNCMKITLYNNSTYLNPSASLCWGEDDQTVYYMTGFYTDASLTKANKNEIYKIILGKGTNDYSADGYGTFISGKSSAEYNGTCKIVKTYSGDVMPGRDVDFTAALNAISTPQGMVFDGYIYVGWSYCANNFIKIELDDVRNEYHVVDNYIYNDYGTDQTTPIVYEPEVTAIYSNKLICGSYSQTANKSLLMVFNL